VYSVQVMENLKAHLKTQKKCLFWFLDEMLNHLFSITQQQ
jgi:hypothetical protein